MPSDRETRIREKLKARAAIKSAKEVPCLDCGISYPYYVMDFDHVRGEKLFNIGASSHFGYNKILIEIAKCDIVCANCHRIRCHSNKS
jgi:hypothetical protein